MHMKDNIRTAKVLVRPARILVVYKPNDGREKSIGIVSLTPR